MKRLSLLVILIALATPAGAPADGCPPSSCGTSSSAQPGSQLMLVRPNGASGPLVAYDLGRRSRRHALPPGMLSANGRHFVVARWSRQARTTTVLRYSVELGGVTARWSLPARHQLVAVSARGDRIVLAALEGNRRTGRFTVRDAAGRLLRSLALRGAYDVEAISPDARRLFLVHYLRNGYELQLYDFAKRRLSATPVANEPDEKMIGTPWSAVASRDGRWLLTLYLEPNGGGFVHALDLRSGVGYCLDLHYGHFNTLGSSALVLSPDERTLYVASPLVGRVAVIDLRRPRVSRVLRFRALAPNAILGGVGPSGAISPGGGTLYFTAGSSVLAYDTAPRRVRGPYAVGPRIGRQVGGAASAIGFAPGGRKVVVLRLDGRMVAIDAATGGR